MTARIDIPESYAIFGPYDTIRPALLVIDADGRRVTDIPLAGQTVDSVASALQDAFWISMAMTIMAGLAVGTMLTMILVPTFYTIISRIPSPAKS